MVLLWSCLVAKSGGSLPNHAVGGSDDAVPGVGWRDLPHELIECTVYEVGGISCVPWVVMKH